MTTTELSRADEAVKEPEECPDCEGRGVTWFGETCMRCAGYGDLRLEDDAALEVTP